MPIELFGNLGYECQSSFVVAKLDRSIELGTLKLVELHSCIDTIKVDNLNQLRFKLPKSVKIIVQMNKKNLGLGLATLALFIAHASTAQAALINGVTASTDMGESPGSSINNIVNGSGLSSLSLTATHTVAIPTNAWGSGVTTGNITFNLNGTYSLAGFSLWNFNFPGRTSAGVNGVNVQTSTDGSNFTSVTGAPTQFAIATSPNQNAEQFSFAPIDAAFVRFNVLSNYGDNFTGLGEVQFNSASVTVPATAVPEPLTIFGTLVGLGGGAALKRRLKKIESKSV